MMKTLMRLTGSMYSFKVNLNYLKQITRTSIFSFIQNLTKRKIKMTIFMKIDEETTEWMMTMMMMVKKTNET